MTKYIFIKKEIFFILNGKLRILQSNCLLNPCNSIFFSLQIEIIFATRVFFIFNDDDRFFLLKYWNFVEMRWGFGIQTLDSENTVRTYCYTGKICETLFLVIVIEKCASSTNFFALNEVIKSG